MGIVKHWNWDPESLWELHPWRCLVTHILALSNLKLSLL